MQDLGIARLAREVAPELEIHGSTQMSIANAEGVRLAQRFGVRRVVLARELSLHEIRALQLDSDCELEVFVHGALCVSYSGQCFSSEAWGGRSANRGQCAQACRLPYDLLVDEEIRPLDDARYLLSPGDLYALHEVRSLVEIGISALKIEGRYKEADYVALTTRAYRAAVDISQYQCGTPPVLSMIALDAALDAWDGVSMGAVRAKSMALTDYFIALVEARCDGHGLELVSPRDSEKRGSQVSFSHQSGGYAMISALIAEGVIGDFRAPDILRFGFAPLYTRFVDVWNAVDRLVGILDERRWDQPLFRTRRKVT